MIKLIISAVGAVKKDAPILVAGSTAGTGVATKGTGVIEWIEWIPTDIGKVATLVGIIATIIITSSSWYSRRLQDKHTILQTRILERQASEDFSDFEIDE